MVATLGDALEMYEPVIGLEVHAQLSTNSKIFSASPTSYAPDTPNRNITPYCIGHPGVLPVLNRAVVNMAIRAGLALECEIREVSEFSRKHYFYPDLPKGYQISQFDRPICEHGRLEIRDDSGAKKTVGITRIHLEEDAGKNIHVEGTRFTHVDYNRAGVPLIEIVSEPDIRSAREAADYLRALHAILTTIGVCDGNMERGNFRCDANVSIRKRGAEAYGTRCEIKNVNSFRFVEQAIEVEILRHARVLSDGGTVQQETRLYDSAKRQTRGMRSKEEAHDYRYFPDPDLPPLVVPPEWIAEAKASLPELPAAKMKRYVDLGVAEEAAFTFANDAQVAGYFDDALAADSKHAAAIGNLVKGEVLQRLKDDPKGLANVSATDLAKLAEAKESDKISSSQQKKIFAKLWAGGADLEDLLKKEGGQVTDTSVLMPIIEEILTNNPKEVAAFKGGKTKVLSFFIGQVMRATKGKAKPPLIKQMIIDKIGGEDS